MAMAGEQKIDAKLFTLAGKSTASPTRHRCVKKGAFGNVSHTVVSLVVGCVRTLTVMDCHAVVLWLMV